jgi:hypothetical protein
MTTLLDHRTTLAYLAYLGYPQPTSALQVSNPRKYDRRKNKSSRNVFLAYVCGAAGSGKTSLLRSFAGKQYADMYEQTAKMLSVVNSVDIDGSEKYLVVSMLRLHFRSALMTHVVARVWVEIRGRDAPELEEDGPGGRHCVRARFQRHQLVFVHQQPASTPYLLLV